MTKADWDIVKKKLSFLQVPVIMIVDGYKVCVRLVMVSTYKNAIEIYINDKFKGEWLMNDCEERRRFLQCKEKSLLTAEDKKRRAKLSKKLQRELAEMYPGKYKYYSPFWTSFSAMKKHLIANNKNIELIPD